MSEPLLPHQPPLADALAIWPSARVAGWAGLPGGEKAVTLWVRLRWAASSGLLGTGEIVGWPGADGGAVARVVCRDDGARVNLGFELRMDAKEQPLELSLPFSALGADERHDLVLRYLGHRIEFWVDGVLVDEEWPLGCWPAMTGAPQLSGAESAAIWDRALNDDEIGTLTVDGEDWAARETRILGPQLPVGEGWKPRGFNTHVGDCMPFFHAGRFRLFYLFDRRNHRSKWGLGAHQWAQVSTTDLVNWEHHPMAIALTQETEGSICTGSVMFHEGVYLAFYAVRMADGSASPLSCATSRDGIHFAKQAPLARLSSPYRPELARDPCVFRDEATGWFHLLVTTSLVAGGGCLAHLVSRDFKRWEQREPFLVPGYPEEPECPDYFEWRGLYYLIFSIQGVARYRMSRSALGPWQTPAIDTFGADSGRVMKTAAFFGDRRIGAAFVPRIPGEYGGRLLLREIIQHADGTLATGCLRC